MTLSSTEEYYLGQFIASKHGISFEKAVQFLQDPENESEFDYEFMKSPSRFGNKEIIGSLSTEFREIEDQLEYLNLAYCRKTPQNIKGYQSLIQVIPEKQTELTYGNTEQWYTDHQRIDIISEILYLLTTLQRRIYEEENVPEEYKYLYDLNLTGMIYALEEDSDNHISVDYLNQYNTFRSKRHKNGYLLESSLSESSFSLYADSLGMRLDNSFAKGELSEDDFEDVSDEIVDCFSQYYNGPLRQLVGAVDNCLKTHLEDV
jgi:hypothetical protein